MSEKPRLRFAPSPTGMLHVGGVRTALYNWLFARHHAGTFILRIEDTDETRNSAEAVTVITSGLAWLGLDWDEGPFYQSQRQSLYAAAAKRLETKGLAYRSTKGEEGKGEALLFRTPGRSVAFEDLVKGVIEKPAHDIVDFVIMRSSGWPTYNFACAVDDIDMRITHVIRGDDHVENTFRQLLLYEALAAEPPRFAHLPMIHNEHGQKLSKRDGAVAVTDYQQQGYLPEAVVNYLALLGWSPGDNTELMAADELIRRFDLDRVKRSAARFDFKKFRWMNAAYVRQKPATELAALLKPRLAAAGRQLQDDAWLAELVGLEKERMELLADFLTLTDYFFSDDYGYDEAGVRKFIQKPPGRRVLETALARLPAVEFSDAALEDLLRQVAAELQVGFGRVAQPIRLAISGRTATPGIFETMRLLGKDKVLARIRRALEHLGGG